MKNVSIFQITAMTAACTAIPDLDCSLSRVLQVIVSQLQKAQKRPQGPPEDLSKCSDFKIAITRLLIVL